MLLWDDNPSEVDLVGFDDVAAPVLKALGRKHLDPICVGVFGPWGAGKTTVIRLIQQALDQDGFTIVIYTQPWIYDPATDPKVTLIGEVLNGVRSTLDDSGRQQLGARLGALAKRVRWSRAIRLAAESALTASLPRLSELEGLFARERAPKMRYRLVRELAADGRSPSAPAMAYRNTLQAYALKQRHQALR